MEEEDYEERETAWRQPCFTPAFPTEAVLGICLWEGEAKVCGALGETAAERGTLPWGTVPLLPAPSLPLRGRTEAEGSGVQLCKALAEGCKASCRRICIPSALNRKWQRLPEGTPPIPSPGAAERSWQGTMPRGWAYGQGPSHAAT